VPPGADALMEPSVPPLHCGAVGVALAVTAAGCVIVTALVPRQPCESFAVIV